MTGRSLGLLTGLVLIGSTLVGCGSGDDDSTAAGGGTSPPASQPAPEASTDDGATQAAGTPGDGGTGSATLVVGDMTYRFDSFLCAFGYANTQSDIYSFSSNSIGEIDGVRTQMQLDVEDPSGGDQLSGDGVTQQILMDDISNFEDPAIKVSSATLDATFDGDRITAEGTFYDEVADPGRATELPGTFEATCGEGSAY